MRGGSGIPATDERKGRSLSRESPACQTCHQYPPPQRATSQVIEMGESISPQGGRSHPRTENPATSATIRPRP